MSKIYGYARVSTQDQNLDLQLAALKQAHCDHIYTDHGVSGAALRRPGLERLLKKLKPEDTLVVWRLDRLGRSLHYLITTIENLQLRNIHFVSLQEDINTSTPSGKLMFHIMAVLAEFERNLISERTRAGIAAARASGKPFGKPRALSLEQQQEALQALADQVPLKDVAQAYSVSPRTIQRLKAEAKKRTQ